MKENARNEVKILAKKYTKFVSELVTLTEADLREQHSCGDAVIEEIIFKLADMGLQLETVVPKSFYEHQRRK